MGKRDRSSLGRVSITAQANGNLLARKEFADSSAASHTIDELQLSIPATNHEGDGFPSMLLTCREIRLASLAGSAPPTRLAGRRSDRGSTWMNSRWWPVGFGIRQFSPRTFVRQTREIPIIAQEIASASSW